MNLPSAPTLKEVVESLVKVYGPFAFGIVSLLVIWFTIMRPMLEQSRFDYNSQQETAESLHDTAIILDRMLEKLEAMAENE